MGWRRMRGARRVPSGSGGWWSAEVWLVITTSENGECGVTVRDTQQWLAHCAVAKRRGVGSPPTGQ